MLLMSVRPGAPYGDRVEEEGRVLIYEGHDAPNSSDGLDPKSVDQPERTPQGSLTQNGLFAQAARASKDGQSPELVKVYEKLRTSIWVYNGQFRLLDAWREPFGGRSVFKFRLEAVDAEDTDLKAFDERTLPARGRLIPKAAP